MGVRGVSRDIADDAQLSAGSLQRVQVHKVRDLLGKVYAVDEDVALGDLIEGTALGGLSHVPLEDLLLGHAGLEGHVDGTAAAASQGADDDDTGQAAGLLLAGGKVPLDVGHELGLVGVARDGGQRLAGVRQLPGPVLEGQRAAAEAGRVTEGGHTAARLGVVQELQVQERTATAGESGQDRVPASLLLVAVCELDTFFFSELVKHSNESTTCSEYSLDVLEGDFVHKTGQLSGIPLGVQNMALALCDSQVSSGSSFSPTMMWDLSASRQLPVGTRVAPTVSNSASSKMRTGLFSTLTV